MSLLAELMSNILGSASPTSQLMSGFTGGGNVGSGGSFNLFSLLGGGAPTGGATPGSAIPIPTTTPPATGGGTPTPTPPVPAVPIPPMRPTSLNAPGVPGANAPVGSTVGGVPLPPSRPGELPIDQGGGGDEDKAKVDDAAKAEEIKKLTSGASGPTTPPDMTQLYMKLLDRAESERWTSRGLGLIAAGLSRQPGDRGLMINAMSGGGAYGGESAAAIMNNLLQMQQMQQKTGMLGVEGASLAGIAKKYDMDPSTVAYLHASGKLGDVITTLSTQDKSKVITGSDGAVHIVNTGADGTKDDPYVKTVVQPTTTYQMQTGPRGELTAVNPRNPADNMTLRQADPKDQTTLTTPDGRTFTYDPADPTKTLKPLVTTPTKQDLIKTDNGGVIAVDPYNPNKTITVKEPDPAKEQIIPGPNGEVFSIDPRNTGAGLKVLRQSDPSKGMQAYQDLQNQARQGKLPGVPSPDSTAPADQKWWKDQADKIMPGKAGVSVSVGGPEKTYDVGLGKRLDEVGRQGDLAVQSNRSYQAVEEALKNPNISLGPGSEFIMHMKQIGSNITGQSWDGLPETEVLNKFQTLLATEATKQLTSRPALLEFRTNLASVPGLQLSRQGNAAMLNILKQANNLKIGEADLADRFASNRDAFVDSEGNRKSWTRVKQEYEDQHPFMSPFNPSQQFGKADLDQLRQGATDPQTGNQIDPRLVDVLIAHRGEPNMISAFDARYGVGSAMRILRHIPQG